MSKQRKRNWIEGLEPPGVKRRLDIVSAFPVEKITLEGVRRTVRSVNPAPKVKQPCFVCGRHRGISQSHHLIEVSRVASVLDALAIFDWAPHIPAISVCPNHHAYEHVIRRSKSEVPPDVARELRREVSAAEWERLFEIDDLRSEAHDRVWQEVRKEFLRREEAYKEAGPDERGHESHPQA